MDRLSALHDARLWRSVEQLGSWMLTMWELTPAERCSVQCLVASAWAHTKQHARAARALEELLGRDDDAGAPLPLSHDALLELLSRCHRKRGDTRAALDALERTHTRSAHTQRKLAQLHEALGNRRAATKCWMALLREHGQALEAQEALVWLGASPTDLASFLKRDAKRRAGGGAWLELQLALLRACAAQREGRTADWAAELAALERQQRAPSWQLLGWQGARALCDHDWAAASAAFDARARLEGGLVVADADLGVGASLQLAQEQPPGESAHWRAQRATQALARAAPLRPEPWLALAHCCMQADGARALRYATRAAALCKPRHAVHARALVAQARAQLLLGTRREAAELLARAYAQHPLSGPPALELLVATRLALGQPHEALRVAKAHYRLAPQSWRALVVLGRALTAFGPAALDKAREVLGRALALGGPRESVVQHVAAAARDDAHPDGAVKLLMRALGLPGGADGPAEVPVGCLASSTQLRLDLVRALLVRADEDRQGPWAELAQTQLRAVEAAGLRAPEEAARLLGALGAGAGPQAGEGEGEGPEAIEGDEWH